MYKTLITAVAALAILQAEPALANKPPKAPNKPATEKVLIELKKAIKNIRLDQINTSDRPVSP